MKNNYTKKGLLDYLKNEYPKNTKRIYKEMQLDIISDNSLSDIEKVKKIDYLNRRYQSQIKKQYDFVKEVNSLRATDVDYQSRLAKIAKASGYSIEIKQEDSKPTEGKPVETETVTKPVEEKPAKEKPVETETVSKPTKTAQEVVSEEKIDKSKVWLAGVCVATAVLLATYLGYSCGKTDLKGEHPTIGQETSADPLAPAIPVTEEETAEAETVDSEILDNVNDEEQLTARASLIKSMLPEDVNYSIDNIKEMIQYANNEYLDNKLTYDTAEDMFAVTNRIADLSNYIDLNRLYADNNQQYSGAIEQFQTLANNIMDNRLSETERLEACKQLNDITATEFPGKGNILLDANPETYEICASLYDMCSQTIWNYTAGHGWSTIYGDSYEIDDFDGNHKFICEEELKKAVSLKNTTGVPYLIYENSFSKNNKILGRN